MPFFAVAAVVVFAIDFILQATGSHINGDFFTFQSLTACGLLLFALSLVVPGNWGGRK